MGLPMEAVYSQVVWPLAEQRGGTCYDAFARAAKDPSVLLGDMQQPALPLPRDSDGSGGNQLQQLRELLLEQIARRLALKPSDWRATIDLRCGKRVFCGAILCYK